MEKSTIPTIDDYRNADRSGKSNMRSMANAAIMAAIDALDIDAATAWRDALRSWSESNTRSTVPTDWNALASVRVATLRRAADMIESGTVRPNGIPDEIELTFDSSATADDDAARRIATDSIKRSEKSDMRGVITASVVPTMEIGRFYTVAEIAHMVGSESDVYASRNVSHGAVRNALESNKIPNVRFVPSTSDHPNGCVRES